MRLPAPQGAMEDKSLPTAAPDFDSVLGNLPPQSRAAATEALATNNLAGLEAQERATGQDLSVLKARIKPGMLDKYTLMMRLSNPITAYGAMRELEDKYPDIADWLKGMGQGILGKKKPAQKPALPSVPKSTSSLPKYSMPTAGMRG